MFGTGKGAGIFAGFSVEREREAGIFVIVSGPGFGDARILDRAVFDEALASADDALRSIRAGAGTSRDVRRD